MPIELSVTQIWKGRITCEILLLPEKSILQEFYWWLKLEWAAETNLLKHDYAETFRKWNETYQYAEIESITSSAKVKHFLAVSIRQVVLLSRYYLPCQRWKLWIGRVRAQINSPLRWRNQSSNCTYTVEFRWIRRWPLALGEIFANSRQSRTICSVYRRVLDASERIILFLFYDICVGGVISGAALRSTRPLRSLWSIRFTLYVSIFVLAEHAHLGAFFAL